MTQQLQFDLFDHIVGAFAQPANGRLTTTELYRMAAGRAGMDPKLLNERVPVGKDGALVSVGKRALRWQMQTAKMKGLIQRVQDRRGVWEITDLGLQKLRTVKSGVKVLAFSTDLGVAILANCEDVIGAISGPIHCVFTSPEYPLAVPRAYGNAKIAEYVDKMCRMFDPVMKKLAPGATVTLSLSSDIFEKGSPARSTYLERLVIAFEDRLGLKLMDRLVWSSNKLPGPILWASMSRQQLNVAWEPIYIFCAQPELALTNNRRVLEPHSEAHLKLIANGGEKRRSSSGDGANRIRPNSFGKETKGKIMKNVIYASNVCKSQRQYKKRALELGLLPHGASMPLALVRKLIRFLTDVDHTVLDLFSGSLTTGKACELEGRQWICIEKGYDYIRGGAERFVGDSGFKLNLP